jgi:hypothetical protein
MGDGRTDPRFLTSALVGGEWSVSQTCHFAPGESVLGTQARRSQGPIWTTEVAKILDPTGTRTPAPSVVQSVAGLYTVYATAATLYISKYLLAVCFPPSSHI